MEPDKISPSFGGFFPIFRKREAVGEVCVVRLHRFDRSVIRVRPVELTEVETDFEVVGTEGVHKGSDQVSSRRSVSNNATTFGLRVPQRNAVMVLRGQDRILRTGFHEQLGPFRRVVPRGSETIQLTPIDLRRHLSAKHRPGLRNPLDRIDSIVDENAKFGVRKPRLHHCFWSLSPVATGQGVSLESCPSEDSFSASTRTCPTC